MVGGEMRTGETASLQASNKDLSRYTESVRRESTEIRRPQVYSWGRGDCGQLGLGSASDALWKGSISNLSLISQPNEQTL